MCLDSLIEGGDGAKTAPIGQKLDLRQVESLSSSNVLRSSESLRFSAFGLLIDLGSKSL